jgi:hypothetical protein
VITESYVIQLGCLQDPRRTCFYLPRGVQGKHCVPKREYSVVNFNPPPAYDNLAEPEKRTVEKPDGDAEPDQKNNHMFSIFLEKGTPKEKEYNPHGEKHNGILYQERFYEKHLRFHGV